MHASQYLRSAANVELQAEELYLALSRAFAHAPVAREIFVRLAFEERQHALRFQLLLRLKVPLPWTAERLDHLREHLDRMAIELVDMKARLSRPDAGTDPYVVLREIADMEDRFSFLHAEQIASDADPRLREVFSSMARQDAEHARLVRVVGASRPAGKERSSGA